jgi:hypothetical protein
MNVAGLVGPRMAAVLKRVSGRKRQDTLRYLSSFSDGLGKVRYIAISDWITQSVLSPLHEVIRRILKRIPSDYTYRQMERQETLRT